MDRYPFLNSISIRDALSSALALATSHGEVSDTSWSVLRRGSIASLQKVLLWLCFMRCNSEPELRNVADQHGFYKLLLTLFKSSTQTNLNFKPPAETPNSRLYMGVWFWNKSKSEGLVMFCLNCKSSKCCTLGHRCLQTKSPIGVLGWGFSHFSTKYSDTCMPIVGYNRYYLGIYNL